MVAHTHLYMMFVYVYTNSYIYMYCCRYMYVYILYMYAICMYVYMCSYIKKNNTRGESLYWLSSAKYFILKPHTHTNSKLALLDSKLSLLLHVFFFFFKIHQLLKCVRVLLGVFPALVRLV